ncbi:invasion associated locus B family protein [uncultured Shimia sp.]|uniref:invasion associated locus B family protein n=1 Tax=uncultured Shimia sp. TaxID=573152 RepID=UPI0026133143|nr:invasion associated locus B family protein [uncultured Shimia sp.]
MTSRLVKALAVTVTAVWGGMVSAQATSENQVNAITDWSVFEHKDSSKRECWAVSTAKESVNTRGGQVVAVRRSDILLLVSFVPTSDVAGQVGFTGGYPFAGGSTVDVTIDGQAFVMITDGEWAWPASSGDDAKMVAAMKRGADATFNARSSRGTKTSDTFSLRGFTAAVEDAEKRCK